MTKTEYQRLYMRQWNEKNRERRRWLSREWNKRNASKVRAAVAKRRARRKDATPPWFDKHHAAAVNSLYLHANYITEVTGIPHEVDHIEPLQAEDRCGLHVCWNLQVLTRNENRRKSNRVAQ